MSSNNRQAFTSYLTASSLWMGGMSLQGFLFSWLLVGVVKATPEQVGWARLIAETGPLAVLLIGGVLAERYSSRNYLFAMHFLMAIPPLVIAGVFAAGQLSYAWIVLFGASLASIQALSDPSRQAVLSRVSPFDAQRSVTLMTIVTSSVGIAAFYIGGELEQIGLGLVLIIQALLFLCGAIPIRQLPPLPPLTGTSANNSPLANFAEGLKATWSSPLLRHLISLNFVSSLFNAGAYIVAIPFIVTEIYSGDAKFFSIVFIVFTIGSIGSNLLLYFFMPLLRPGRLFLLMQLSRVLILFLLWIRPEQWLFFVLILAWGLNMGVTTTMVRAIVQEEAIPEQRARVLSILLLSFLVSSAVTAPIFGFLVGHFDPLTALLPGIAMSLGIFAFGFLSSDIWGHESKAAQKQLTQV